MIYRVDTTDKTMMAVEPNWVLQETELESYLLPEENAEEPLLDSSVFGESLLLVSNQVKTRHKKRADILALDKAGNGVIVELKRDQGALGVETQALQYLADFSTSTGQDFIDRFSQSIPDLKTHIPGFLGPDMVNDINKHSRIILVARSFDPAVYSMGEWLSQQGVSFRCIEYTPFEIAGGHYLSFSVVFDRSTKSVYPLIFQNRERKPGYFWHNIGFAKNDWWNFLVERGQISTGFDNRPGDQGERILRSYIAGDIILAYCSKRGAIGWGIVEKPNSYRLIARNSSEDRLKGTHLHRLDITWKAVARNISEGISPDEVRAEFGIYHPVSTSVRIDSENARQLVNKLNRVFAK
jgi:hypothetical protein